MLRELQVTMNKPANAMYKSGEEKIITGMAVIKNETNTPKAYRLRGVLLQIVRVLYGGFLFVFRFSRITPIHVRIRRRNKHV